MMFNELENRIIGFCLYEVLSPLCVRVCVSDLPDSSLVRPHQEPNNFSFMGQR